MASYTINPIFSFNYTTASKSFNPKKLPNTTFFISKISKYHPLQRALFPENKTKATTTYCCTFNHQPLYIPNKILNDSYVRVLDTTLRDGEQAPGATMTPNQKLAIARQLAKLGVDIIEAGFPVSSPSEFETTRMIAMEVGNTVNNKTGRVPVITGLSRLTRKDIDVTWEALKGAKYPRLMTFIPSSEIHMKYKIKKTKEEVLRSVKEMVSYARGLGIMDIEFATEDSSRSEKEFLYQVFEEAIKAGATTITFADTVGCKLPNEWGPFIADMKANIVGVENVIIATHCHDDLGVATANTLAAVNAGARQVHVTMNGIGERAGNAPLEEFAMALKSRGKDLQGGLHTGINTRHILKASKMVEEHSGFSVQPNKAIVGANAFSHGSGIHQDGVLKNRTTYEFLSLEEIGWSPSAHNGIVLGKLSGRHALKSRFLELGYELDTQKFDDAFRRFKLVAEKKKTLSDNDLVLLMSDGDETFQPEVTWKLVDMEVRSSTNSLSRATIKLIDACGKEHVACGVGTSSIHATCKAIDDIVKVPVKIVEYDMKLGAEGLEGIASIRVVLSKEHSSVAGPQIISGSGGGLDMIMATARAYMNALNKLLALRRQALI